MSPTLMFVIIPCFLASQLNPARPVTGLRADLSTQEEYAWKAQVRAGEKVAVYSKSHSWTNSRGESTKWFEGETWFPTGERFSWETHVTIQYVDTSGRNCEKLLPRTGPLSENWTAVTRFESAVTTDIDMTCISREPLAEGCMPLLEKTPPKAPVMLDAEFPVNYHQTSHTDRHGVRTEETATDGTETCKISVADPRIMLAELLDDLLTKRRSREWVTYRFEYLWVEWIGDVMCQATSSAFEKCEGFRMKSWPSKTEFANMIIQDMRSENIAERYIVAFEKRETLRNLFGVEEGDEKMKEINELVEFPVWNFKWCPGPQVTESIEETTGHCYTYTNSENPHFSFNWELKAPHDMEHPTAWK